MVSFEAGVILFSTAPSSLTPISITQPLQSNRWTSVKRWRLLRRFCAVTCRTQRRIEIIARTMTSGGPQGTWQL
ncbi:hypothetical protein BDW60DRAFT_160415 [Aspergillus nidulans var. acristatus]